MNNVVCIKYGRYYAPFYVNRLFAGVKPHAGLAALDEAVVRLQLLGKRLQAAPKVD